MANARDIAKERCQQNLYVTGKKHWEKDVSANKNVERTKMPSSRDTERQSEREREIKRRSCQGKGPSKKNRDVLLVQKAFTETRHAKCLARTPRVLEESNLLLETPANRLVQALLVEIHLLAATLSSFRKQPFVEQNGAKKYDSSETSLIF